MIQLKKLVLSLTCLGALTTLSAQSPQFDFYEKAYPSEKQQVGKEAMVVCAHPVASEIGKTILEKGGNAIDAMVAVHFALAVAFPRAGNIGGGGFLVYRESDGDNYALDFREMAPAAAHRDMYLDENGEVIPEKSRWGHLAVGVPGSVDGMVQAHARFGHLTWAELVQPAVELAEFGIILTEREAAGLNSHYDKFDNYNEHTSMFNTKKTWKEGDLFKQPELAEVLKRIRDEGLMGFYAGETADLIVADMKANEGIITHEDLLAYRSRWRTPVEFDYKDYHMISMPPPSSGGIVLAEMLQMIEPYNVGEMGYHSTDAMHVMVEAERRAYADRAKHLGDADFYPVPTNELIEKEYAKMRMVDFDKMAATNSDSIEAGDPQKLESEETTHYSIVDKYGNAVSVTTTINSSFGSHVVSKGTGIIMNNEMDDFSAKPGAPNLYGLLGTEANAVAPGKRMLSSMTPTIVTADDELFMVVGTPGGSTIITSVFQVFVNVVEFDQGLKDAVHNPRFHHQWKPDQIYYEQEGFENATIKELEEMGHTTKDRGPIGRVDAILVLPDGQLEGVGDWRGDDSAAGY